MSNLLFLTSYARFELNSWRNNEITDIFDCRDTPEIRNDVMFKQWL